MGRRSSSSSGPDVACAASGKSGGFLALDWCDGTPLEALARRSFALHARLAEEIGEDWGYRRLDTFGGVVALARRRRATSTSSWVSDRVAISQRLGSPETTAQVHPARFTRALMRAAEAHGAELRIGQVIGRAARQRRATRRGSPGRRRGPLRRRGRHRDGTMVDPCRAWLPLPAVFGLKGHSIVFDTGNAVPAEALFLEHA